MFLLFSEISAQPNFDYSKVKSDYVLNKNKEKRKSEVEQKLNKFNSQQVNEINEDLLRSFLYEADLIQLKSEDYKSLISKLLKNFRNFSNKTKVQIIESVHSSFRNQFIYEVDSLWKSEQYIHLYVLLSYYLLKNNHILKNDIFEDILTRFPESRDKLLHSFKNHIQEDESNIPPVKDLLDYQIQKDKTIIFTFFRKDRNYKGISIIRNPDGNFLRNDDGSIFYIPQLGLSVTNLPGFLKNGNTPRGIYSIVGWYITPTESIGPTPIILTRLPYEVPPDIFFHGKNKSNRYDINEYKSLLPESWRNYSKIEEAFYAGELSRKLIIMHGSADDLEYFENEIYYPLTPSKGCLTTKEIWNNENGTLVESDQVKLMKAFFSTKQLKGYLFVIDLDDQQKDISIKEIETIFKK